MKFWNVVEVESTEQKTIVGMMVVEYTIVFRIFYLMGKKVWTKRHAFHIVRPVDIMSVF